ncbi:MAG: TIM-barrel domain-containing protein [Prolixibacteraceae bacterium]
MKLVTLIKQQSIYISTCSLLVALLFTACSEKETVSFLSSSPQAFTEMRVDNLFGKTIQFVSTANEGAIGYELNGDTVWLYGQPQKTRFDELTVQYEWGQLDAKVTLKVELNENDVQLNFSLNSNLQPTRWIFNTHASENEFFTGIFERVVDGSQKESWKEGISTGLNLRGEAMDVRLKPTVSAYAPFYISSENYAVFVHGTWPGHIDFCKANENVVKVSFEGPVLQFSILRETTPAELVKKHAMETGPAFLPPKWAFGPWRWRDDHNNNAEYFDGSKVNAPYNADVVEDVLMMEAYDIPCTAYWIDRPWGPGTRGFDDYKIDYERLPNFEAMVPWLNKKNMELMLWIGPWIMGDMAATAERNNYSLISRTWGGSQGQVLMDFSNPEACRWWAENGPAKLAKMGVKGFKLDRADGEKLLDSLHLITASGKSYRENFNNYSVEYVKATYDAVHPILGDDMVLFPRAQYTGSSRYGAMWAGDTGNSAEGLRSAIIAMLRCSVMGYPFWGSDTGGYPKRMEREVTMRWMGFSCFSPLMEVGPTNNLGFWGMNYEPSFDHELLASWRFYTKLRMHMLDYIYEAAISAQKTGMPVARPLFLEYSEQAESWNNWTTYKFGDDLLIGVVWENGKTSCDVYLPEGEIWINAWTKEEFTGGKTIVIDVPLSQIPVFQRKGSTLLLPDLNELYQESIEKTAIQYNMNDLQTKEWPKL